MSYSSTLKPERAQTCAMPLPMVPAPRIAIVFISVIDEFRSTFECSSLDGPAGSGGCKVRRDSDQKNGDIVVAAIAIGRGDQVLARRGKRLRRRRLGDGREDFRDLLVVNLVGEAVGGEQVDVVGLGAVALNLRLNRGLGAYGPRDQIAHRRLRGLLGGNLAGAKLLFDQRVVVRELLKLAAAAAVAAAVADVAQPECRRIGDARVGVVGGRAALCGLSVQDRSMQQTDERSAHAGKFRRLPRLLVDSLIRGLNRSVEAGLRLSSARRRGKVREE